MWSSGRSCSGMPGVDVPKMGMGDVRVGDDTGVGSG